MPKQTFPTRVASAAFCESPTFSNSADPDFQAFKRSVDAMTALAPLGTHPSKQAVVDAVCHAVHRIIERDTILMSGGFND